MANIWRIKTTEDANSKLCLDNHMIAIGWPPYVPDTIVSNHPNSLNGFGSICRAQLEQQFIEINTYEAYEEIVQNYALYEGQKGRKTSVNAFVNKIKIGDYVWITYRSQYYLGKICSDELIFKYHKEQKIGEDHHDYLQRPIAYWIHVGDETKVPGAVVRAFAFRGNTVQCIEKGKEAVAAYSKYIEQVVIQDFNGTSKPLHKLLHKPLHKPFYRPLHNQLWQTVEAIKESLSEMRQTADAHQTEAYYSAFKERFFNLLGTDDCEDLLCFWLYHTYGYIPWPSSNKRQTATYECILLDPKNPGKEIYIQVKSGGSQCLESKNYTKLLTYEPDEVVTNELLGKEKETTLKTLCHKDTTIEHEVFLFTAADRVILNHDSCFGSAIKTVTTDEIFKILLSKESNSRGEVLSHSICTRIMYWLVIAYNQIHEIYF
ncbi:hypothetical protein [uncultured Veillonella sp.]|uniref:hypothetical protein n=1 Tax=uncultured Veillonella sp. TaxID=159268 RepID=UPI002610ADCB|nr:hypothetical protein [uncultured Veillonella sp.]